MHIEPMSVILATRPRRLYRVLTWLITATVTIGISYARAADNAVPAYTTGTRRIRDELGDQNLPIFSGQAGRYLTNTSSQLYAYGTLPNRYVLERQVNWELDANRLITMQRRSIGGDAWARIGLLQADIDGGPSRHDLLRPIYTQDGKPQYVTTTAESASRILTQRCTDR